MKLEVLGVYDMKRILIICRSFSPDSIVGAKRMSMFAKYLSNNHDVTVVRSGNIYGVPDASTLLQQNDRLKILSYEGENNQAELYEKEGVFKTPEKSDLQKGALKKRSNPFVSFLRNAYRFFLYYYENIKIYMKCRSLIQHKLNVTDYDLVITTFSPLGSTLCGYYLKRKDGIKWIMDLRDLMDNPGRTPIMRSINSVIQKKLCNYADLVTTPTNGFRHDLLNKTKTSKPIAVIYNGYDLEEDNSSSTTIMKEKGVLRFCYTGTIHNDSCTLKPLLDSLDQLSAEGVIEPDKIIIEYAGKNSEHFNNMMTGLRFKYRIIDHGYLSHSETMRLQKKSDIFMIMVMNMTGYTGVLTGKLCEAVQFGIPVIGFVSGDLANSELKTTIDKYKLGFCYEEASTDSFQGLKKYIYSIYNRKVVNGLPVTLNNENSKVFDYRNIIEKLEEYIAEL